MGITNKSTNPSSTGDDTDSNSQSFASAEHTNENDVHLEPCFAGLKLQKFSFKIYNLTVLHSVSSTIQQFLPANKMDLIQTLEKSCLRELYGDCMTESLPSASFKRVSDGENNLTLASTLLAMGKGNDGNHEQIQGEYYEVHCTNMRLSEINDGNGIIFRYIGQRT